MDAVAGRCHRINCKHHLSKAYYLTEVATLISGPCYNASSGGGIGAVAVVRSGYHPQRGSVQTGISEFVVQHHRPFTILLISFVSQWFGSL